MIVLKGRLPEKRGDAAGKAGIGSESVSYTHLDVYKRQVQDILTEAGDANRLRIKVVPRVL